MESVKKWLSERSAKKDGLYVHYSPPKLVGVVAAAQLRRWAREGAAARLERAVLAGQGRRLLREAGPLPISPHLPVLVANCDALHTAVERGSLLELQEILESGFNKRKYVTSRDEAGVGLLHKAVFYDYMDIAEWLVKHFPHLVNQRDSEGRTPLHYAAACRDEAAAAALLEGAGAARGARDAHGRTPAYYRGAARTRLALPTTPDMPPEHKNPQGLVIKRHNLRIWFHDCDMAKLQRVVWEGHGTKLLSEVSNQPVVKKFLEAVPYIMNTIREIHKAVVNNNLEDLMKHASHPVPPAALSSRDVNFMTVMHKAAGLGYGGILKYITDRYPQGINDVDKDGRTPLHYAAAVRDEQHTYDTLVGLGADESVTDNKNKTPAYYRQRYNEIDKNLFKTIPDAPRTPSSAYPPSWDWQLLETEVVAEQSKKSRRRNNKVSNENISSNSNTNTISESTKEYHTGTMKASSTHELIKGLPDLNAFKKSQEDITYTNKDSDVTEDSHDPDNKAEEIISNKNSDINEIIDNTQTDDNDDTGNVIGAIEESQEDIEDDTVVKNKNETDVTSNQENKGDVNEEKCEPHEIKNDDTDTKDKITEPEAAEVILSTINNSQSNLENHSSIDNNQENLEYNHDEAHDNQQINISNENIDNQSNKDTQVGPDTADTEGNNNEDDDDVQTQGETQSEYSDFNLQSTAEASDTKSAKRGYETDGRNAHETLIEGLVSGEAEVDSQDARNDESIQREVLTVDNEIDPEVAELINNANMEMLAALVLNGEGARLVGRHSRNLELQSFLDNVPTYMKKINKVHLAAREGNIRELQSALDRRKFAIARDLVSPNGTTPLHVATVFGKTNIIKYLGGRFPETLSAVDYEGRTALHYAAVLPDNGHYYNLLQQLGANSKDLDDNGRSAEDYHKNPTLLPFDQLVTDFGISDDTLKEMLSDKGRSSAGNGHMDIPMFKTDEGRYLAKSLGDPLIKGLTEVANVKPKDPVAFLASFLQNFPEHEKPRLGTQETNVIVTKEPPEVENEQPPPPREANKTATVGRELPIDVITVEPQNALPEASPDAPEAAFSSTNRDEHGQSMLHFAAARTHTKNALFELLQESDINLAYRDELYRTARDVSIQANVPENTAEIDRWVLHLAARGNSDKIMELLMEGYDHILDTVDEEGIPITEVVSQRNINDMTNLLASIPAFEESRENLHGAIRRGDLAEVQQALEAEGGRTLARSKNSFGRTALHVAVLAQHEEIVAYLAQQFPELLRLGDNLERTPLHYAMGVDKIESLSRVLIRAGAKRVLKDLKGRQPTYYFMNKSDILRLKEEEEVY